MPSATHAPTITTTSGASGRNGHPCVVLGRGRAAPSRDEGGGTEGGGIDCDASGDGRAGSESPDRLGGGGT